MSLNPTGIDRNLSRGRLSIHIPGRVTTIVYANRLVQHAMKALPRSLPRGSVTLPGADQPTSGAFFLEV